MLLRCIQTNQTQVYPRDKDSTGIEPARAHPSFWFILFSNQAADLSLASQSSRALSYRRGILPVSVPVQVNGLLLLEVSSV